jgi:hypothetical protein
MRQAFPAKFSSQTAGHQPRRPPVKTGAPYPGKRRANGAAGIRFENENDFKKNGG